ncbi:response regulator [Chryseobacterium sp. KCF3-3]|uniref:response regulator n=1 Tax=Chryseobacterium sp. KCF3-3 TaxID=3231511 RepID=UPI0038B390A5
MNKKIIIADNHFVVRIGATLILKSYYKKMHQDHIICNTPSYSELTNRLLKEKFDLLILDMNMPGSPSLKMIKELKEIQPELKILIFSIYGNDIGLQYIIEGAEGYLNKSSEEDKIIEAVESIFEVGKYYSIDIVDLLVASMQKKTVLSSPIDVLSEREKEIFDLFLEGYGNLEVSNILNLHKSTINTYKIRIFKKLNIKTIADLIRIGDKNKKN